jgi:hypothetical protein
MGIDQEIPVDLHLDASYELLDAMRQDEFVSHPVPEGFSLDPVFIRGDHEEDEPYTEDIYGPLRYCNPPSFADIVLPEGEVPLNKAALAYVLALPGEWPIILYWS